MKNPLRPLLSTMLLIGVVVVLTLRVALRHGPIQLRNEAPFVDIMKLPSFNETLLRYASIDIAEPQWKRQIQHLLDGNLDDSNGRRRSFLSPERGGHDVRARSARGLPVRLRSPELHRVWLSFRRLLQDWSRNRRYQADIMLDSMSLVKGLRGGIDDGKMGLESKYSSCAVVGNSGILLKSEYGELIDSHEVVIRLNNARIGSYERNVGKKTTVSFVNSNILHFCARRESCYCHPYGLDVPIAMYICQPAHFLDYLLCNSSHKAPLIITDPRFDVLCSRIVKYYSMRRFIATTGKDFEDWVPVHDGPNFHYSSGMQAVMLAVGACDRVSIFGFGKSADAKHHYHTNQKVELGLHDYEAEYDLYRDLVSSPQVIPFISDKFKFPPVVMYH